MGNSKPPKYKYKPKPGGIRFVPGVYMLKNAVESVESSVEQELETLIENLWRE